MIAEGHIVLFRRLGRLAVVNADILVGGIGKLDDVRMLNLRRKLAEWIHPA